MIDVKFSIVFEDTDNSGADFRTPSAVVTKNGVILAFADRRCFTGSDVPNKIEQVMRRSVDGGESFGETVTLVSEVGVRKERSSASFDPCAVYNPETGRVVVVYCHTPSGVGMLNCKAGLGEDAEGKRVLWRKGRKYYLKDGRIYRAAAKGALGKYIGYTVDGRGYYFKDGKESSEGNIRLKGGFKEANTAYLMMIKSDDDGLTWSKPVCLNAMVKAPYMCYIGTGTGAGITLGHGKYKGRMIVPVYFNPVPYPLKLSCAVIYSDDNGESWKIGLSPNRARLGLTKKPLNLKAITPAQMLSEAQVVQLEDGTLKMFMESYDKKRRVAVAYSDDGGESWRDFAFASELVQPHYQFSLVKTLSDGKPCAVFANPASKTQRVNGTVRLSEDDGETFTFAKRLYGGEFLYSCLTVLPDGEIGLFFEGESMRTRIYLAKFPLEWIKEPEEEPRYEDISFGEEIEKTEKRFPLDKGEKNEKNTL